MKPTIDYFSQDQQMGDLLASMNVFIGIDFTFKERETLRKQLENYMMHFSENILEIDMKKFILKLKGVDEVGYLLRYV
ncbi:hypothetical protein DSECCO2_395710 [anaerobic digester metagenome]